MITRGMTKESLDTLEQFFYTESGKLYAREPYGRAGKRKKEGEEVGWPNLHGYYQFYFQGKVYMVHRVIYFLHYKRWPVGVIDHINGDGLDNNPNNLRDVSHKQNCRSFASIRTGGKFTSKYRGVSLHKPTNRWRARFVEGRKEKSLGYFDSEADAALAWNEEAIKRDFNKEALNTITEKDLV